MVVACFSPCYFLIFSSLLAVVDPWLSAAAGRTSGHHGWAREMSSSTLKSVALYMAILGLA